VKEFKENKGGNSHKIILTTIKKNKRKNKEIASILLYNILKWWK
jgi:hypothetical protein